MVLRGGEGNERLAVGQGEEGALGALHHLLDHDGRARIAEDAAEALAHALERLLGGLGDDDALAGGQAVGLDHDRAAHAAHVVGARGLVREAAVGRGGDASAQHDLLGELLRALHLRRVAVGAEGRDAGRADRVGDAGHERGLRADDHEADAVLARPASHGGRGLDVELDALGGGAHAAVAGGHIQLAAARRLGELDHKGVLAAAGTQKQDVDLLRRAHVNLQLIAYLYSDVDDPAGVGAAAWS